MQRFPPVHAALKSLLVIVCYFLLMTISGVKAQKSDPIKNNWKFMSYNGLVMAGYQGWFNAEGDGADRGWNHYTQGKKFEPGSTKVDYWPDVSGQRRH